MDIAPSAKELQLAILELDVLYEDLTQNNKQRQAELPTTNSVDIVLPTPRISRVRRSTSDTDEDDYDIPRPAGSVFNSPLQINKSDTATMWQQEIEAHFKNERIFSKKDDNDDYSIPVPPTAKTRSPAVSVGSKASSSGIGTIKASRVETTDIRMRDDKGSRSDSDYDEVASDDDLKSDADYAVPVKSQSGIDCTYESEYELMKSIAIPPNHRGGGVSDPDYDEVCSDGSAHEQQVGIETTSITEQSIQRTKNEKRARSPLPSVSNSVSSQQHRVTSDALSGGGGDLQIPIETANEEASDDIVLSSPVEVVVEVQQEPDSRVFHRISNNMTTEQNRQKRDDDNDCPCECPAAVPLMSCAVVLCFGILIFAAVSYIYFGLRFESEIVTPNDTGSSTVSNGSNVPVNGTQG